MTYTKNKFNNYIKIQFLPRMCDVLSSNLFQFTIIVLLSMCVLFYSSFVCISAYANVYSKTTVIKQNIKIILIAGVPKSQAVPVYLITAHHLCAFLMYLAGCTTSELAKKIRLD